jgi:plasmid maintenance system antidote protein VapI
MRAGFTQGTLASAMKMSPNTLNIKVNGGSKITVDEAKEMCAILGIENNEEKCEIFLS